MTPKDPGDRRRRPRMDAVYDRLGERLVAIFFLGAFLFNPLCMRLFDRGAESTVFGVPLFFFYLFGGWTLLIVLLAAAIEGPGRRGRATPADTVRPRRSRNGSPR